MTGQLIDHDNSSKSTAVEQTSGSAAGSKIRDQGQDDEESDDEDSDEPLFDIQLLNKLKFQ